MAEVKFTEEEMKSLKEIQESYFDVQNEYGKLELARIRVEQQLDGLDVTDNSLREKFVQTQSTEKEFLDGITKKYGEGTLDQESGVFISNKLK